MFYYTSTFVPNTFVVIGTGGTGSRLVPLLAQFVKTLRWIQNPRIILFDPDVVEEKNLVRQNFIKADIGKNKAQVLADRYAKHYEIPIFSKGSRLGEDPAAIFPELNIAHVGRLNNSVIFLCVDSVEARKKILGRFFETHSINQGETLILDAGNEDDFGQIQVFTSPVQVNTDHPYSVFELAVLESVLPGNLVPFDLKLPGIPINYAAYSGLKEGAATGGCADLDQTLAINTQMAVNMLSILQNFVYGKKLLYHRLNVSLTEGATPEYMTVPWYLARLKEGEETDTGKLFSLTGKVGVRFCNANAYKNVNPTVVSLLNQLTDFREAAGMPASDFILKRTDYWSEERKKRIAAEKRKAKSVDSTPLSQAIQELTDSIGEDLRAVEERILTLNTTVTNQVYANTTVRAG